ncbi:hypothetical protein TrispH2_012059, partial [Trichoplax sp. H2]
VYQLAAMGSLISLFKCLLIQNGCGCNQELISTSLITINLMAEMGDVRIYFPEKHAKQVQKQILVLGGPPEHNVNAVGMSEIHRLIIRKNRDNIVTNISTSIVDSIIEAMFSQGVITYDHKLQLSTVSNPYTKVRNFLDILCERGSKAFEQFCITVRRFYSELADKLERQAGLSSSAANFNSGSWSEEI